MFGNLFLNFRKKDRNTTTDPSFAKLKKQEEKAQKSFTSLFQQAQN